MNWKFLIAIIGSAFICGQTSVIAQPAAITWDRWRPLVGHWQAAGKGTPGEGGFSFAFDLQNKVLVRKSHSDYPAAKGRSEEHTSELQSLTNLVCRLLLEKK